MIRFMTNNSTGSCVANEMRVLWLRLAWILGTSPGALIAPGVFELLDRTPAMSYKGGTVGAAGQGRPGEIVMSDISFAYPVRAPPPPPPAPCVPLPPLRSCPTLPVRVSRAPPIAIQGYAALLTSCLADT